MENTGDSRLLRAGGATVPCWAQVASPTRSIFRRAAMARMAFTCEAVAGRGLGASRPCPFPGDRPASMGSRSPEEWEMGNTGARTQTPATNAAGRKKGNALVSQRGRREDDRPAAGTISGRPAPRTGGLTCPAGMLSSDCVRITPRGRGAAVDRTAGARETCGRCIAIPVERYTASDGCYVVL